MASRDNSAASVERWQARGWQVENEHAVAGTFDEVFLSRPGRDVHALVAAEGDEVVVDRAVLARRCRWGRSMTCSIVLPSGG